MFFDFINYCSLVLREPEIATPCSPSPCGANAKCTERNGAGACKCLPEYFGDPYLECRPECVLNSDCSRNTACVNNKCKDPCPGVCGNNAECYVANHSPSCSCFSGYTGNPSVACYEIPICMFYYFIIYRYFILCLKIISLNYSTRSFTYTPM